MQEALVKFFQLVQDQFTYGGVKYGLKDNTTKETTDILFDTYGTGWFFGTLNKYCYDELTEILTNRGWKFFKDLNRKEKIATLNPQTNTIEYYYPIEYQIFPYHLPYLYRLKNEYTDLVITPFHDLYYRHRNSEYRLGPVDELIGSPSGRYYLKLTANWETDFELSYIMLPEFITGRKLQRWNRQCSTKEFVKFLGWYLSEGCIVKNTKEGHYTIIICQSLLKNREKALEIDNLLRKLNIKFHINKEKTAFIIYDKSLWCYLSRFGKSHQKFIPQEIKNLKKEYLMELFIALIKGDGHAQTHKEKKYYQYFTVSKKLADDIQEIALKLGYHTKITQVPTKNFTGYNLSIREHYETLIKKIEKVPVDFPCFVYDVTMPVNNIIYVRRNGKACWSGNCFRYKNVEREKDLLKLACYSFLLWLKRGFFLSLEGSTEPLNTTVEIKTKYFDLFKSRATSNFSDRTPNLADVERLLLYLYQVPWPSIQERDVFALFGRIFVIWKLEFFDKELAGQDTDTHVEQKV